MITDTQLNALTWLNQRGGRGGFTTRKPDKKLLARGEYGPYLASTWTSLADGGYLEIAGGAVTVTSQGITLLDRNRPPPKKLHPRQVSHPTSRDGFEPSGRRETTPYPDYLE